mmetsp:Transcript_11801/g.21493  ORF Transcript_11801/g.21493 Transcript_11801/m.21493 type:complete len:359 (+) Transcript_11801:58-1134(+)
MAMLQAVGRPTALRRPWTVVPEQLYGSPVLSRQPRELGASRMTTSLRLPAAATIASVALARQRRRQWAVPEFATHGFRGSLHAAGRGLLQAVGITCGLLALLTITSVFEKLSHSTSGLMSGQSPMLAAVIGVAVGTLHTVAGPDHLASLAPMVIGRRRSVFENFGLGALWGSGHATGQLIIGIACLLVKVGLLQFSWAEALGQVSGWLVGISLIGIGVLGIKEVGEYQKEMAGIDSGLESHNRSHGHSHSHGGSDKRRGRFGWATYGTGVLHGLSPDAIVFLIPALALPRWSAVSHIGGVVLGTLVAMGAVTAALGALCQRAVRLNRISTSASGVAILLGVSILLGELGLTIPLPGGL